jgi:predicted RNase H-like HicB family nuclease
MSSIRNIDAEPSRPVTFLYAVCKSVWGTAMRYKIALLKTDEGYSVSVPGLPGCWSQGATEEEALENIQDAIQGYLATRDALLEGAVVREIEIAS